MKKLISEIFFKYFYWCLALDVYYPVYIMLTIINFHKLIVEQHDESKIGMRVE